MAAISESEGLHSYRTDSIYQDLIAEDERTHGSTFILIILGNDKTTVSVTTGQNDFYPLYLSVGNVRNNVWHAHHNALVLVGFLAMPKSKLFIIFIYISFSKWTFDSDK